MRLLVCGSRHWTDRERVRREILEFDPNPTWIMHGTASGADTCADLAAQALGMSIFRFPARWLEDGLAAGPIRNERMLREGRPDRALAFGPLYRDDGGDRGEGLRRARVTGTGDMVRRLIDANVPVRWVPSPTEDTIDLVLMPFAVGRAVVG